MGPINMKAKRRNVIKQVNNTSVFIATLNGSGLMSAVIPNIQKTLKMFDPIAFPIARSVCPWRIADTVVASSGSDVPIATMVRPIILSLNPACVARIIALSTIHFPPRTRPTIPIANMNSDVDQLYVSTSSFSVSTLEMP